MLISLAKERYKFVLNAYFKMTLAVNEYGRMAHIRFLYASQLTACMRDCLVVSYIVRLCLLLAPTIYNNGCIYIRMLGRHSVHVFPNTVYI